MAGQREEECYENTILTHFHVCKGLSNDDVGAAKGTVLQEMRLGAGFKTGDFVKGKPGGASYGRTTLLLPSESSPLRDVPWLVAT